MTRQNLRYAELEVYHINKCFTETHIFTEKSKIETKLTTNKKVQSVKTDQYLQVFMPCSADKLKKPISTIKTSLTHLN